LDEVAIYNRVLTLSEVQQHFNGGAGKDYCEEAGAPPDSESPISSLSVISSEPEIYGVYPTNVTARITSVDQPIPGATGVNNIKYKYTKTNLNSQVVQQTQTTTIMGSIANVPLTCVCDACAAPDNICLLPCCTFNMEYWAEDNSNFIEDPHKTFTVKIDGRVANETVVPSQITTVANEAGTATVTIPASAYSESLDFIIAPSEQSFVPMAPGMTQIAQPLDLGPQCYLIDNEADCGDTAGCEFNYDTAACQSVRLQYPATITMPGDCTGAYGDLVTQKISKYTIDGWISLTSCDYNDMGGGIYSCQETDGRVSTWDTGACTITIQTYSFSPFIVVGERIYTPSLSMLKTVLTEGIHTLSVNASNAAGLKALLTKLYYVDLYPPETAFTPLGTMGNNGWYTSSVEIALTASDSSSGVDKTDIDTGEGYSKYTGAFYISAQGETSISYYSTDRAGWTEDAKSSSIKIDSVKPETSIGLEGELDPSGWYYSQVTVTLTAYDATSDISMIEYSLDEGNWILYTAPFVVSNGGLNYVRYRSTDNAGNVEEAKVQLIKIDNIPPDATVATDPGMWSMDSSVTITWTPVEDLQSGTDYYKVYRCSVTTDTVCDPKAGGTVVSTTDTTGFTDTGLQDGTKYFYAVTVVDKAGQESAPSNIVDIIVDMSPPYPPELYPISSNGFLNIASAVLSWSEAKDEGVLASGLKQYNLFSSNAAFSEPLASAPSKSLLTTTPAGTQTYTHLNLQNAVTYYYDLSANDNAGNVGNLSNEQHVTVDLVAPSSTAEVISGTPGTQGWYTSSVYIQVTSTDEVSKVRKVEYRATGATTTPTTEYTSPVLVSAEGTTTIYYTATDNAGNEESEKSITVKIDTVKPVTTDNAPAGWQKSDVTVALNAVDLVSGIFATKACKYIAPATTCTPSGNVASVLVTAEGITSILYNSVDKAGNEESVKTTAVYLDKTVPITTAYVTGTLEPVPYNDTFMTTATVTLGMIDPLPASGQASGVASTLYCVDQSNSCIPSTSYTVPVVVSTQGISYMRFNSVDVAGNAESVKSVSMKIDKDSDGDGTYDNFDACNSVKGFAAYQGCPFGDQNTVDLHIIDQAKLGKCGTAGSCKFPLEGASVRVFDRNNAAFQALWTKNPSGTQYPAVYENGAGWIGAGSPLLSSMNASCITTAAGMCISGEATKGDFLVIVKWKDAETGKTVYTGLPKGTDEFKDTNGDKIADLATKNFQIMKTYAKGGAITYNPGEKTVVLGSTLEIIRPQYTIWENTRELYPFIFTSDSEWTIDVCMYMPQGYSIASVIDSDGNEILGVNCTQAFIENETKTLLFTLVETGSPEPDVSAELTLTNPHGVASVVSLDIPGKRIQAPFDMMLAALLIGTAIIVAIVINLVMMKGKKKK
jgi:hypothetical protein